MKTGKVKFKLTWEESNLLTSTLEDMVKADYNPKKKIERMFLALWMEAYLKFIAKNVFAYQGQKSHVLSIAQAVALEELLKRKVVGLDGVNPLKYVLFQEVIGIIDQQTTV